jgi:GR25 family glycosyltransferase involved in LPS biosynthesis
MNCCYITSYFDINRSQWKTFARTFEDYLLYFQPFLPLFDKTKTTDELIVFIDDRHIHKLDDLLTDTHAIRLIPINESFLTQYLHCWKLLETERRIMNSPEFKALVGDRMTYPECRYPEYTLINHSKIDFIAYAINFNLSLADYFAWVDFGFFSKSENIPTTLLDLRKFDLSCINYTLINPISNQDSDVYYTLKYAPEKIGGFFFLGRRDVLLRYQTLYHDSLAEFHSMNIVDDDQALALYCYFKSPNLFAFNTSNFGWHNVFVVNQIVPTQKKVIAFCLWGHEKRYTVGLIQNIKLASLYYPDWICYIYIHHLSLTPELKMSLKSFSNIKLIIKTDDVIRSKRFMLWRIEPIMDKNVDVFISRDIDTRIFPREVLAVRQWLSSDKVIHIMRDHPQHYNKILGGMFGVKTERFRKYDWNKYIEAYFQLHGENENDQHFLEKYIYNMTSLNQKMIHDEIKMYENHNCLPYPIPYEHNFNFTGCYIYEDESPDPITHRVLQNYIMTVKPHRLSTYDIPLEAKLSYIRETIGTIYIIHYTKLESRKTMMIKQLAEHLLDINTIKWVDTFDREMITVNESMIYSPMIHRDMTRGEIANMMAHESVLQSQLNSRSDINLVIEDDCIFKEDFIHHLYQTLLLLENEKEESRKWDMCCLGGPVELNTYPARALDKSTSMHFHSNDLELFTPSTPAPCTVSGMLYHRRGVQKIITSHHITRYQCPSDHAVWLANIDANVTMKWIQPFITYEGSKTDMFNTSFTERGF